MTTLSSFRINQPPGTPGPAWDRAREDLDPYSLASEKVECEALEKSQTSYLWEVVSTTPGVTVSLNNPTTHTCDFELETRGGYMIRLTVNAGEIDETATALYVGIPLEHSGISVPALSESNQDNSRTPYDGSLGTYAKMFDLFNEVDSHTGTLSPLVGGTEGQFLASDGSGGIVLSSTPIYADDAMITVPHGSTDIDNGTNLKAALTAAASLTPGGEALSATNHSAVRLPPGRYDLNQAGIYTIGDDFVDIIGAGTLPAQINWGELVADADIIHSNVVIENTALSGAPLLQFDSEDFYMRGITVETTQDGPPTLYVAGAVTTKMRFVDVSVHGSTLSVQFASFAGYMENFYTAGQVLTSGFIGDAHHCSGGDGSYCGGSGLSGRLIDCVFSASLSDPLFIDATGYAERCVIHCTDVTTYLGLQTMDGVLRDSYVGGRIVGISGEVTRCIAEAAGTYLTTTSTVETGAKISYSQFTMLQSVALEAAPGTTIEMTHCSLDGTVDSDITNSADPGSHNWYTGAILGVASQVTNDSAVPGTTVKDALETLAGAIVAEDLWDKATTTLSPKVSGDSVNIATGAYYKYNGVNFAFADTSLGNYFTCAAGNLTATGSNNVGGGYQALLALTTGDDNVAFGQLALTANTTGSRNTAIGSEALNSNTAGNDNTASGYQALTNTTGSENVAIGSLALNSNAAGNDNSAFGYQALAANTNGINNTGIGHEALYTNILGNANTALGKHAGYLTTGSNNTYAGFQAGDNITTADNCLIIGYDLDAPSATADYQMYLGGILFGEIDTGKIGINTVTPSEMLDVDGSINISTGSYYKYNGVNLAFADTVESNFFFGGAGNLTATGGNNNGFGEDALSSLTTGTNNSAFGHEALSNTTEGGNNTAAGFQALLTNVTGAANIGIGRRAGFLSTGNNNIFIGYQAGDNLTAGNNNLIIGFNLNAPSATGSSQMYIGGILYGDMSTGKVGINTTAPGAALDVLSSTNYNQLLLTTSKTNEIVQRTGISSQTYLAAEEPLNVISVYASNIANAVRIGGGPGEHNAATEVSLYTAANTTTVTGTKRFSIDSAGYATFADSATTTHSLAAAGDVFVSGKFEADGDAYFDGNAYMADNKAVYFGDSSDAALVWLTNPAVNTLWLGLGPDSNHIIIGQVADTGTDFAQDQRTDPTLIIQSADAATGKDQFVSFSHNQSDAFQEIGSGGKVTQHLAPVVVADDASVLLPAHTVGDYLVMGWGDIVTINEGGGISEHSHFTFVGSTVNIVSSSANVTNSDTGSGSGNICIYNDGTQVIIQNRLGYAVTLMLNYEYSDVAYTPS